MTYMRSSGFVEEGRLRKANWVNGVWRDVILMGVLVDDWTELRKLEQQDASNDTRGMN